MNTYHNLRRGILATPYTALLRHFRLMEQPTYQPTLDAPFWDRVEPFGDRIRWTSYVIPAEHPFWEHWRSRYCQYPECPSCHRGPATPSWKAPTGHHFVFLHPSHFT